MDESIALTSIGRDGERSDLVTNTKKPEIFVYDGTIIATAEKLLFAGGNLSDSGNDAQKNGMNSGISGNTGHNRNADAYGRGHYPSCMQ